MKCETCGSKLIIFEGVDRKIILHTGKRCPERDGIEIKVVDKYRQKQIIDRYLRKKTIKEVINGAIGYIRNVFK